MATLGLLAASFWSRGPFARWLETRPKGTLFGPLDIPGAVLDTQMALLHGALVLGAGAALITICLLTKAPDVGMVGNGAIAALVAITAPSGYIEPWAAIVIGAVAGAFGPTFEPSLS